MGWRDITGLTYRPYLMLRDVSLLSQVNMVISSAVHHSEQVTILHYLSK
jgi:hypothetical protein